jgi:hypothetical protein
VAPQPDGVEDTDRLPIVLYETLILQRCDDRSDLRILHAHGSGEESDLQLESPAAEPIVHAEQPAAASLVGCVQTIARDRLDDRSHEGMAESVDQLAKPPVARQLALEKYDGHVFDGAVGDLHEAVAFGRGIAGQRLDPDDPFAADAGNLDTATVGHFVDDRAETRAGKIDTGLTAMRQRALGWQMHAPQHWPQALILAPW